MKNFITLFLILLLGNACNQHSDENDSEVKYITEGREPSTNVLDLRPRACATPNNCYAGFLANQCLSSASGLYNSGLCDMDYQGNLTSVCHVAETCCDNPLSPVPLGGCQQRPVDATTTQLPQYPEQSRQPDLSGNSGELIPPCQNQLQETIYIYDQNGNLVPADRQQGFVIDPNCL